MSAWRANLGIGETLAVVIERRTGMEQHVGDARHGNEVADGVLALRQGGQRHRDLAPAVMPHGAQGVGVAAARQPDLPQHRRQHGRHPYGLLAMFRALECVGDDNQRAPASHRARQGDNFVCRNAADHRCPGGVLRLAVDAPKQIILECRIADAEALQKSLVVQVLRDQRVRQAEHQRGVGVGHHRQPMGPRLLRQVVAQGADQHEACSPGVGGAHGASIDMTADATGGDRRVLQRHAAERDHHFAVRRNLVPGDAVAADRVERAQDVRQDHRGGPGAVRVHRADITAEHGVQEPVHLALRMMEAAGAGPAIRATEDRMRPMRIADASKLRGEQVERPVPRHRNEGVAAAPVGLARAVLQPPTPHHRMGDAGLVAKRGREIVQDAIWIRIGRMRPNRQAPIRPARAEGAPMRAVRAPLCRFGVFHHSIGPFRSATRPSKSNGR